MPAVDSCPRTGRDSRGQGRQPRAARAERNPGSAERLERASCEPHNHCAPAAVRDADPHAFDVARTHASGDDRLRLRQRQRGVSDHLRGRGVGRPSGPIAWSLTPRHRHWRPHGHGPCHAGGEGRRPLRVQRKVHGEHQLQSVLVALAPTMTGGTGSGLRRQAGGNTSREPLFPPGVPPPVPLQGTSAFAHLDSDTILPYVSG